MTKNQFVSQNTATSPNQMDNGPIGLVLLWRILWRSKIRILTPAFLLSALAVLMLMRGTDTYSSEAQILLTRGNLNIVEFDASDMDTVTSGAVTNAMTILTSRNLALDVVNRLDLTADPNINPNLMPSDAEPAKPSVLQRLTFWRDNTDSEVVVYSDAVVLQSALTWLDQVTELGVVQGSNVISIRVTTTNPAKSVVVADAYAQAFLEQQVEFNQNQSQQAADALAERLGELRFQLEEDQNTLQEFKSSIQTVTTSAFASMVEETKAVRARVETMADRSSQIEAAFSELEAINPNEPTALRILFDANPTLSELERTTIGAKLSDTDLVSQLPTLRALLVTEYDRLMSRRQTLESTLASLEAQVTNANEAIIALRQLEVEVETSSQVYESSLARLKELVIQTGLRDAGAQILLQAQEPLRSDGQGRVRTVIIFFILGLFLGIGLALIRDAANQMVRTVSDMSEVTGSTAIVQLPRKRRSLFRQPISRDKDLYKGLSPFFDGVRTVRQMLTKQSLGQAQAQHPDADPTDTCKTAITIGIFSALDNEGKTTMAITLARSYVMINKRVLIIDGDMRKGDVRRNLDIDPGTPGLQEILANNLEPNDVIQKSDQLGFDVLLSGEQICNPADLLESQAFSDLFEMLKESYDIIIVDTPPILILPEARRLAAQVDQYVIVTVFDKSPKPAVRDAVTIMKASEANDAVFVLGDAPSALGQQYGKRTNYYANLKT